MPIGSILGGIIGSNGAANAGGAAGAAGDKAYDQATNWAKQLNGWLSPWSAPGRAASSEITSLLGLGHNYDSGDQYGDVGVNQDQRALDQKNALARFTPSPDYQFRMTQGTNALDRSAASRGMVLSGAQWQAQQKFGGDLASGEYNNYFSKLMGVSDAGRGAETAVAGDSVPLVTAGINDQFAGGMSRANSMSSSANALASGIGNGINSLASLASFGYGNGWFGGGAGGATPSKIGGVDPTAGLKGI